MTPPKRALFSLNYHSDVQHVDQHVERQAKDGQDSIQVFDTKGPTRDHTDLSYLTQPFERTVNRAVNDVVQGTGKQVHSAQGDLHYTAETSSSGGRTSTLSLRNPRKQRALEKKYDTSDL